ncbi:MAG: protein kinase domain-containing protein [Isosphaeraceae bacterium]
MMIRSAYAPRDLLLGLLALQNALVTRDQLVLAFAVWTAAPGKPLAALLNEQGALRQEHVPLLEALVDTHLKVHGGDAERSIAALDINRSTRESLAAAAPAVEASIAQIRTSTIEDSDGDADRTTNYAAGSSAADGARFRILRPHASGGLGAVFIAFDAALNREVALKQILPKLADEPESRRRFLIEAEITGGLEHPGIVPVYGLGTDESGRPYYAMRFIKGDSLKEAIERFRADATLKKDAGRRSLELRSLLRRFTDVCNTIEYAHSRRVLHRDVKPANVIVGKHGETLVIDWGLAKSIGGKAEARADRAGDERSLMPSSGSGSAETLPGSALGTPAYMSPEQAAGDLDQLGPQSDVYSLGATLYCLLTGKPPFEGDVGEVLRKVKNGEFVRPRQLDASIDPALEAICLKAMATKPDKRYPSCLALKDDVERWAADEPVSVFRAPAPVRLARWARKHRTAVAVGAGLVQTAVVVLAVSTVLLGQSRTRIDRERRAALAAQARAQAVNNFLVNDLLAQAGPERFAASENVTVRQVLDRAVKSMDLPESSIAGEPSVEGAVRSTIGYAYLGLGVYPEAEKQLRRAYVLLIASDAPMEDVLFARNRALWARALSGRFVILGELDQTLKMAEMYLGREHPETVYAAANLAALYRRIDRAVPLLRENLEIQRRRYGLEHELTLRAASNLVVALRYGRTDAELAEAESLARETGEAWVRRFGPEFPQTLSALQECGMILASRGKMAEARTKLQPIPDAMERVLGPDHYLRATASRDYGWILEATGDLDGAIAQYRQALAILSKGLGGRADRDQHEATLNVSLARIELTRGHDEAAGRSLLPILPDHAKYAPFSIPADRYAGSLADALAEHGDPKIAIELLTAVLNDARYLDRRLDWLSPHLQSLIGGYNLRLGDRAQANANLREAVEAMERAQIKAPAAVLAAARARLARLDVPGDAKGQPAPPMR